MRISPSQIRAILAGCEEGLDLVGLQVAHCERLGVVVYGRAGVLEDLPNESSHEDAIAFVAAVQARAKRAKLAHEAKLRAAAARLAQ